MEGTVAELANSGNWPAPPAPDECRTRLQAAQLRLLLAFLGSERLAERCPVQHLWEAGRIPEAVAACLTMRVTPPPCPSPPFMAHSAALLQTLSPEEQQALDAQLCLAARDGDVAKLEQLQAEGASVDAEEGNGFTALMCATSTGHEAAMDALLELGADLERRNGTGYTALIIACAMAGSASRSLAQRLLDAGADPSQQDAFGRTALSWAESTGNDQLAAMLRQ